MRKFYGILVTLFFVLSLVACSENSGETNQSSADTGTATDAATYCVTYNGNGNNAGDVPVDSAVYKEGDTLTLPENTGNLGKNARNFAGWNIMADGSGRTYMPGQSFVVGKDNVMFYAMWSFWTRLTGDSDTFTWTYDIAVDSDGNTYIVGEKYELEDGSVTGYKDVFMTKFDAYGNNLWARHLEDRKGARSIAVDADKNIYITGYTIQSIDGESISGTDNIFVTKYDTDCNMQWTRLTGGDPGKSGYWERERCGLFGVAVAADGNVYVTGHTNISFDGETVTEPWEDCSNPWDMFVVKYNTSGERQWTRFTGAVNDLVSNSLSTSENICVDSGGNVFVTGHTLKVLEGETQTGLYDAVVIKYDADGNRLWGKQTCVRDADVDMTAGRDIAVDSEGNVYITGDVVPHSYSATTLTDQGFLMKYNTIGEIQWVKLSGGRSGLGLAIDTENNIYITGDYLNALANYDRPDVCVSKFDSDGNKEWFKWTGVRFFNNNLLNTSTYGYGICLDSGNNIYVTGRTNGPLAGETFNGKWDSFVTTIFNGTDDVAVTNY